MLDIRFSRRNRFANFDIGFFGFGSNGFDGVLFKSGFAVVLGFRDEEEAEEKDSCAGAGTGPVGLSPVEEHVA